MTTRLHKKYFGWCCAFFLSLTATAQTESYFTLEKTENQQLRITPESEGEPFYCRIPLQTDLNVDGRLDLIVQIEGSCSGWSECVYHIFIQESNNLYRSVWADYGYELQFIDNEFTVVNGQKWNKIRMTERGDAQGLSNGTFVLSVLEYRNNEGYVKVPSGLSHLPSGADISEIVIPDVFKVYATHTCRQGKVYEIGRAEPDNYQIRCDAGVCYYVRKDDLSTDISTFSTKAPIVLRRKTEAGIEDFLLPHYQDIDMFSIQQTEDETETLVINGRYEVFLFDRDSMQFSNAIQAGIQMEYGSDAISGTLGGLRYEAPYLIGNAVNFGLFCFDVSDWSNPKELLRISSQAENNGQAYLFLKQKNNGLWDGFTTASDTTTLSQNINGYYTKTLPLQVFFTDMNIDAAKIIDPLIRPVQVLELQDELGEVMLLNMRTLK